MTTWEPKLFAILALGTLLGCAGGARGVDYSRERGVSEDISVSRNNGPTSAMPGMQQRNEPIGAFPWDMDQRHQTGR